ncbi:20-hydroxyecdysone protein isoform X3 [Drosophila navojoa]|uniref:20-hydroxyecdysone protein isoform X3 n=1 Tax=Drosophila navojoa TaxID=7232 RepID=UPI0011BE19FE|nr:20-hydroxyecdysone protein isoform X3 [Drosophila navojoa]
MKAIVLVLLCLALGSQGRVLQPAAKEALDIPVAIVKEEQQQLIKVEQEKQAEQVEQQEQQEQEANTQLPQVEPELKTELPKIEEEPKPKQEEAQPAEPQPAEPQPAEPQAEAQPLLKSQPLEAAEELVVPVPAEPVVEQQQQQQQIDDAVPHVRQATQATPTQQSSTQQNFVQQLIQNSPIGQFLNQFNGQQQQPAVQADQVATPAPTQPGFLNPSAAITSAQNAAQNAVQSVVNSTTQAFQGIQQFASNLGTQFQNTLSGLTGQQQQSAQPTTVRPPGPIQAFVNNVFGGGNNATAAAAAQPQPAGPLQGIINFLGGNRPQNTPAAPAAPVATEAPAKPAVADKLELDNEVAEQPAESENEVRSSAEATDDSFEEAVPVNEVIVVNDDAGAERAPSSNSVEPEIDPELAAAATEDGAVAL